jgi:hypothetical protein
MLKYKLNCLLSSYLIFVYYSSLLFIKFGKYQASLLWEFTTLQEELATQVWVSLES